MLIVEKIEFIELYSLYANCSISNDYNNVFQYLSIYLGIIQVLYQPMSSSHKVFYIYFIIRTF